MKLVLALLLFLILLVGGIAFAQTPTLVPPFPGSPTTNDEVIGPDGQIYVWDGTKWVHGTVAPALITDAALASAYSGVGSCTANQFVTALTRNAAPTCAAPSFAPLTNIAGGANNYAPLASPTFSGTVNLANLTGTTTGIWTFPDGSIYDVNGHNYMKALGIGDAADLTGNNPLYIGENRNGPVWATVLNTGTGLNANAGVIIANNLGHYAGFQIYNAGSSTANYYTAPDSVAIGTDVGTRFTIAAAQDIPLSFAINAAEVAAFQHIGNSPQWGLRIVNPTSTGLQVNDAFLTGSGNGSMGLTAGTYHNGTAWIAATTQPSYALINMVAGSGIGFYIAGGGTAGAAIPAWTQKGRITSSGLNMDSPITFTFNNNPANNVSLDGSGSVVTVANGSNQPLAVCSGMVLVTDQNVNGASCMFMTGGGNVFFVGSSNAGFCSTVTSNPPAGQFSMAFSGSRYTIYSNTGGTSTFGVLQFCTRAAN